MVYPVILPYLREDYSISLTLAGLLLTLLWLAYAAGQIPGGVLGDRIGEGTTMALSTGITAVVLVVIVFFESKVVLFAGTTLLGLSVGLFGVARLTGSADVYPENVGTVHGFIGAAGEVGNTVFPPLVGVIAAAATWQMGLSMFIPLFVVAAFIVHQIIPSHTSAQREPTGDSLVRNIENVLEELRRRPIVLATTIQIFGLFVFHAFTGFFPTYLVEMKDVSPLHASLLYSLVFSLSIAIRPLSGMAYDLVGIRRSMYVTIGLSGFGFVLLPLVHDVLLLIPVTILISFMSGRGTIALAYMTRQLSEDVQNTGLGTIRTIFFMLGSAGPLFFGAIADSGYFDQMFYLLAIISGAMIAIAAFLPSTDFVAGH